MQYFWHWKPESRFPPRAVVRPEEFDGSDRLCVACTQTNLPARQQRETVSAWCDALPAFKGIRFLWFSSKVPQDLFDAACRVPGLEGLYIKWSGIKDLSSVASSSSLKYFHLGQSSLLESIEPLANCSNLQWLGLELLSRITDLNPLGRLEGLEGLWLEGSMSTTWRVESLSPLGHLRNLRYLSIANVRAADKSLRGLFTLDQLVTFHHAKWWSTDELAEIRRRNPGLSS